MGAEDDYLADIDAGDKDKLFNAFKNEFDLWGMWAVAVVEGLGGTLPESYTPADLRELILDLFEIRLQMLCDCPRCQELREANGN